MEADCRIANQLIDWFLSIKHIYFNKFLTYHFFFTTNHFKLSLKDQTMHDKNIVITCMCKLNHEKEFEQWGNGHKLLKICL